MPVTKGENPHGIPMQDYKTPGQGYELPGTMVPMPQNLKKIAQPSAQ